MSMEFFNLCINNRLSEAQAMYNDSIDLGFRDGGGRTPLAMTAGRGHIDVIKWLTSIGSPLEVQDNDGRTALARALNKGHVDVGQVLIEAGANINAVDEDKKSVLINAICEKQEQASIYLINAGADINLVDNYKKTALHHAVNNEMVEVVKLLIEKGCNPTQADKYDNTPLSYAVESHNNTIVKLLEEASKNWEEKEFQQFASKEPINADNANTANTANTTNTTNNFSSNSTNNTNQNVNSNANNVDNTSTSDITDDNDADLDPQKLAFKYRNEITDFQTAIGKKNLSMVKYFIDKGADVNQPLTYLGEVRTPFELALSNYDENIITLIVNSGLNVNERFYDEEGDYKTDYMKRSIDYCNTYAIKLLLEKGFDITDIPYAGGVAYANDYYLDKMIHNLAFDNKIDSLNELVPLFLEKNIIIDKTALENIKYYDFEKIGVDICKQIAKKCTDINEVDEFGRSVLHTALNDYHNSYGGEITPPEKNQPDLYIDILLENEAIDVNLMDYSDFPPLYYACQRTTSRIVKKLLLMGANIDVLCGEYSESLAHVACKSEKIDILKLLFEFGVSVNSSNDNGLSLLHTVLKPLEEHKPLNAELVKLLINAGSDVNYVDNNGNTPLHRIVKDFQPTILPLIDLLLEKGADINAANRKLETPFYVSSISTDSQYTCRTIPILKHLLSKGALINTQDINQDTPLHHAALYSGDLRLIQFLLQNGADINIKNEDGKSPYDIALEKNNRAVISMMEKANVTISMDGDDMDAAFMRACKNGQRGVAEMLVRSGNIDVTYVDDAGRTPLHYIAGLGMTALAKFCIDNGVDINYTDCNNQTALHFAASSCQKEVFKLLVENGADTTIADNNGVLPIHFIANRGQHDMLKILLDSGCSPDIKMNDGASLLHTACYTKGVECVKVLLDSKVDPNILDQNGETPLIVAARLNQKNIAALLIKAGANIKSKDIDGDEALHIATMQGFKDMLKLLLDSGADVNTLNNRGLAPLHIAAYFGYKDIFKFLLEAGANFDIKTNSGLSCIDIASENGQKELVELIGIIQKRRQTLSCA